MEPHTLRTWTLMKWFSVAFISHGQGRYRVEVSHVPAGNWATWAARFSLHSFHLELI